MSPANFASSLLQWFERRARALPWREDRSAYATWISEIMLQQTRAEVVAPYFERFVAAFPGVEALAAAPEEEVLRHWAGLGYYRRARMLHAAARQVVAEGGVLPRDAAGWRALPGVGEYTAAAVASAVHGERVPVVDGNVKRVAARVLGLDLAADDPALHREARAWGAKLHAAAGDADPGRLNESLMELGATVCTLRGPACGACPVAAGCAAGVAGDPERLPRRAARARWKDVRLTLMLATHGDRVLLRRRASGWNPGLYEPPSVQDEADPREAWERWAHAAGMEAPPGGAALRFEPAGELRHVITRHRIRARVLRLRGWRGPRPDFRRPQEVALTALARKALDAGMERIS